MQTANTLVELISVTHTNLSGLIPRASPLRIAGYPLFLAAPSGYYHANVSGETLK